VWAQETTTTELPPIVLEGTTLAVPVAAPKKKTAGATAEGESQAESDANKGQGEAETSGSVEGVPADEVGSAVSVVTCAELKAQQIRHAADALRSLPGVEVSQQGTPNDLTVVRIRSAESNHTLGEPQPRCHLQRRYPG
jgi:vitamin B12 transporter